MSLRTERVALGTADHLTLLRILLFLLFWRLQVVFALLLLPKCMSSLLRCDHQEPISMRGCVHPSIGPPIHPYVYMSVTSFTKTVKQGKFVVFTTGNIQSIIRRIQRQMSSAKVNTCRDKSGPLPDRACLSPPLSTCTRLG